ncbi:SDR family NAD(P)-dependent oxidoreductase [Streptomyces sp. CA-106131]|uniref:SDR family NAD(P)-dependent oxidoreductase n=1 Tax=Streptomyces sp. CA-106131 TaxID=3240045 RepID=UPI003D90F805
MAGDDGRLAGRTALITGAAQGQGAAEARRLAAAGAHVLIADVQEGQGRALAAELGERAGFVRLDVADEDDWAAAVAGICPDWPPLRVLVNNAGVHWKADVAAETAAGFGKMLQINLTGAFLGIRAAVEPMRRAGGGSIVNVCSVLALFGGQGSSAYSTSKWGLRGLTKSAALELGEHGIRVNAIHPGYIDTPMLRDASGPSRTADFYDFLPLRRSGAVEEVAGLVEFLASDDSSYLTGADLAVDGGMTAGSGPRLAG